MQQQSLLLHTTSGFQLCTESNSRTRQAGGLTSRPRRCYGRFTPPEWMKNSRPTLDEVPVWGMVFFSVIKEVMRKTVHILLFTHIPRRDICLFISVLLLSFLFPSDLRFSAVWKLYPKWNQLILASFSFVSTKETWTAAKSLPRIFSKLGLRCVRFIIRA